MASTATRNPTSDEAVSGTWSGTAGSRWQSVDDYPDTAGVDRLTGGTTAAVITFGYSAFAIPADSVNISVQVLYYDGEAANGANNCGGRLKVGGSYFNAATHNPAGTTPTSRSDNWATNPKTSAAWTVDDINGVGANALQAFGINSTDSNPTFFFTSIQLQVTYSSPITGSASATLGAIAGTFTAIAEVQGNSSTTLGSITGTATATSEIHSNATTILGAIIGSATGIVTINGSAGSSVSPLGPVTGNGNAELLVVAASVEPLESIGGFAAAEIHIYGTASDTIASVIGTGAALVESAQILGASHALLGDVTGLATATVAIAGASVTQLGSISGVAFSSENSNSSQPTTVWPWQTQPPKPDYSKKVATELTDDQIKAMFRIISS